MRLARVPTRLYGMAPQEHRQMEDLSQRLRGHAERVEASYKVALVHISLFPADEREKMRAAVEREFENFQSAVRLFTGGVPLTKIQEAMPDGSSVVPWLARLRVPVSIARFSHARIDPQELRDRKRLSAQRLAVFHDRFTAALETVKEIPLDAGKRVDITRRLESERSTMLRAFELYEKGFSFRDIDHITKVGMQDRALDGRLPSLTRYYGGDALTPEEVVAHRNKAARMVTKACEALEEAEKKHRFLSTAVREARMHVLRKECEQVKLVARLYERGITPLRIRTLTKLSAPEWLAYETLPVKLLRVLQPTYKRDFTIPTQHTEETAYVAGAFFARLRLTDPGKILFAAPRPEVAEKLRKTFTKAFGLEPSPTRVHGGMYLAPIDRKAFVEPFRQLVGVTGGPAVAIPQMVIDYTFYRQPFLDGFLSFSGGHFHTSIPRFTLTRSISGEVLNQVAVALSYEGIYPNVHTENTGAVKLQIDDPLELRRLMELFPMMTDARTRERMGAMVVRAKSCLDSLEAYETVMRILRTDYPKGVKLNFEDVREKGGVVLSSLMLTPGEKHRIKGWRAGLRPKVYVRAQKLQALAEQARRKIHSSGRDSTRIS